ncbi:MAG TPA: Lpg1974 family pore-forming outer membrane protein, partial [Chlamydiales bacterium]
PSNSYAQGKYKTGSFDIEPGFRISLSYFRAPKEWEVWGSYTRLTSRGHDSTGKPAATNEFLTGTWPQTLSAPLTGASSSTHLNYNVVDAIANRYFHPNAHLRLRLIGGLTSAWMSQDWVVRYTDAAQESTRIQNKWKFAGGGFRFGLMADWFWTSDIYLTARGTVGALMGCYKNESKQTTTVAASGSDNAAIPIRDATYRDGRGSLTMQASLGPSWQKSFNSTRVEIFAGYEINTWSNLQEIFRSTAAAPSAAKETWINSSLLAIQGLTTRLTMDF